MFYTLMTSRQHKSDITYVCNVLLYQSRCLLPSWFELSVLHVLNFFLLLKDVILIFLLLSMTAYHNKDIFFSFTIDSYLANQCLFINLSEPSGLTDHFLHQGHKHITFSRGREGFLVYQLPLIHCYLIEQW